MPTWNIWRPRRRRPRAVHRRRSPRLGPPYGRPLAGRIALVTGGSRGIGVALAERLARDGAAVAVVARTLEPERGARLRGSRAETVATITAAGGRAVPIVANLADPADRARIVPALEAALGPVDVLVHNAAAAIYAATTTMPLRRRQTVFEVNVHAAIDLAQAVLPAMRAARRGSIIG